jgi:hypothetical protein
LYQEQKKQYDQIEKTAEEDGVYEFCFSNEFSTVTHKVIYIGLYKSNTNQPVYQILLFSIDWKVDGDPEHEITGPGPRVAEGALTMVCLFDFKKTIGSTFNFLDRNKSRSNP